MKLLLDEMYAPAVARQLRLRGHDVVAVQERRELLELRDPDVFAAAQDERRAVVTENVPDYLPLDRLYRQQGRDHHGLILTSDRRFPRRREAIGRLVTALDAFLRTQPAEPRAESPVHWLQ